MRCLLASFADVTRIYGNSQKSVHVKRAFGQGQVKQKPVDTLRLLPVEVTAVGLLTVAAIPLSIWVKFIFRGIIMYNNNISMSRFSNLLFNFAEDFLMASLQISAYWSSESEIFM